MSQSISRALWELAKATLNLGQAKITGLKNPCPPHDWSTHGFCTKCGTYPDRGNS